jgi:perosamine synthetase
MIKNLILTAGPSITDKEIEYGLDAIKNGWNNNHSDYIKKFEDSFKNYTNSNFAMATSSCTGAMHLALLALGIKEGDEVIVPEITWIATAAAVKYVGAKPVFCDVDIDTWTMCPKSLEKLINSKTKAIMPVHIYGHPCDMDPIWDLAKKHNLLIIEDAAQSIGAEYKGQKTGSLGDAAGFSFQGAKALVTGEGGMFLCKDKDIFDRARFKGDHGRDPNKALYNIEIGYKYKMSNVQAAIGLAQIERVEEIVAKKRQIFSWYYDRLKDIEEISLNAEKPWAKNIYWMSSIVLGNKVKFSRDEFMKELKTRNIDSRPIFYPISSFPMFENQNNPNAYFVGLRGINLPSGHNRTEEEVDYICHHIKDLLGKKIGKEPINGWIKYKEEVTDKISKIKNEDNVKNRIPIVHNDKVFGYLDPITKKILDNSEDIELLAKWREENQQWFPSQFKVTIEGTKKWLDNALLKEQDRLLYFVCDNDGFKIGHIGLYRFDYKNKSCELDNVIRGSQNIKGIINMACNSLIKEAKKTFQLENIYLRVFSDNTRAINLYNNIGFNEILRIPLLKKEVNGHNHWVPLLDSVYTEVNRYFVTMKLDNDN